MWCIYETVQVRFNTSHRINVFKMIKGNYGYTIAIVIDDEEYFDTGTWNEQDNKIIITESTSGLYLVACEGERSGFEVIDPPGGGCTWIYFSSRELDDAYGTLGGSDLGSPAWGLIATCFYTVS